MSVILLNGSTAPRVKSSDGVTVLPCGCAHTAGEIQTFLQMCAPCHEVWKILHDSTRGFEARINKIGDQS